MLNTPTGARRVVAELLAAGTPLLVEQCVAMRRELAVLVARSPFGQGAVWPVVQTVQREGICVEVLAPAPGLDPELAQAGQQLALRLAATLEVVGVLAVELFEMPSGQLLVNELAMRPHNSGDWTIEGAATSQFEQHLRAVLDYPLGSTAPRAPACVMANVLGADVSPMMGLDERLHHLMARYPQAKVHLYAKPERPRRKIGHVTVLGEDPVPVRRVAMASAPSWPPGAGRTGTRFRAGTENGVSLVGVIMGSDSDWPVMRAAAQALDEFGVAHEVSVVSAHRTPARMLDYARNAAGRGLKVIIAGAGGAAHLPGMVASATVLPVVGVPVPLAHLDGLDSLLSIVQMPAGVPVATVSIGGARNAGLLAVRILATSTPALAHQIAASQQQMAQRVLDSDTALRAALD